MNGKFFIARNCCFFLSFVDGAMNDQRPMIIGYFPNWNSGREDAAFDINNINPNLYTHLIYAFVTLDKRTFCLKSTNEWIDIKDEGYKKFADLKTTNPKLKLMFSLGGWTDSIKNKTTKYVQLVTNSRRIDAFVKSALAFLEEYNFDGLDLNWKYPNTDADKIGFTQLIVALGNAFKPYGYLLSAAVPPTVSLIDAGYDVPVLNKNLDFINLMAYDFHGDCVADHHSPLRRRLREKNSEFNVDFAINYWIRKGMSPGKINLGIALYGKSWILSSNDIIPPAPAVQVNEEMAYHEICDAIHNKGWTVYKTSQAMGPYAVSPATRPGRMWVGYDDPDMAIAKTNYILVKGLGGVMLWDISMDDFQGISGEGPNPITNAIIQTISQNSKFSFKN